MGGVYVSEYINNIAILLVLGLLSTIGILLLAPIQDKHKKISENEKKAYKRIIKRLLITNAIICIVFYNCGLLSLIKICVVGVCVEFLLVISGNIKNFLNNTQNYNKSNFNKERCYITKTYYTKSNREEIKEEKFNEV